MKAGALLACGIVNVNRVISSLPGVVPNSDAVSSAFDNLTKEHKDKKDEKKKEKK